MMPEHNNTGGFFIAVFKKLKPTSKIKEVKEKEIEIQGQKKNKKKS